MAGVSGAQCDQGYFRRFSRETKQGGGRNESVNGKHRPDRQMGQSRV